MGGPHALGRGKCGDNGFGQGGAGDPSVVLGVRWRGWARPRNQRFLPKSLEFIGQQAVGGWPERRGIYSHAITFQSKGEAAVTSGGFT